MSTPPVFEIRFPAYTSGGPPRCSPKSTLTGVVYLHIRQAMQASCLSLSLMGSERVSLAPESVNGTWTQAVAATKQRSIKKVYFNQCTVLWGDSKLRELGTLPAGIHMFHFSCEFPRVNYPQSRTTPEYEIKYALKAKLLNPRDARDCTIMSTAQPVAFVPETVAPLLHVPTEFGDAMARFAFCDNVIDGQQWAFHVRATALQQAFRPGDSVDLQLRLTGQRPLRKLQFAVIEQTDCFYPQIPEPREEQLDIGRRLWSSQRVLSASADLPFERDSCVVPDLCADHMNSKRTRGGGSAYYAHVHTRLPKDALVLHETGFLRFTYFVQLSLFSGSTAWGTHSRSTQVGIPIPVASRILPENATAHPLSAHEPPRAWNAGGQRRGSSISVRGNSSSSAQTEVDPLEFSGFADTADGGAGESALRHGRSIADLGARLQQFIPRRTPSASHAAVRGRRNDCSAQPHATRAVSHGRFSDFQPQWSMADLPPMPAVPPAAVAAVLGVHADANTSQASLFSSPLARAASLSVGDGNASLPVPALHNQPPGGDPALVAGTSAGSRFSLTFLLKLRDYYHDERCAAALADIIGGHSSGDSVIPSAVRRPTRQVPTADAPPGISRLGLSGRGAGNHKSRDFSLGMLSNNKNSSSSSASMCSGRRRSSSRISVQSMASMVVSSDRVLPRLEAVMTSFRDPGTNQVATWSALGQGGTESSQLPAKDARMSAISIKDPKRDSRLSSQYHPKDSTRYSRLSAMSVSSNDTACASNGCLSLSKDAVPPVPVIHNIPVVPSVHHQ